MQAEEVLGRRALQNTTVLVRCGVKVSTWYGTASYRQQRIETPVSDLVSQEDCISDLLPFLFLFLPLFYHVKPVLASGTAMHTQSFGTSA